MLCMHKMYTCISTCISATNVHVASAVHFYFRIVHVYSTFFKYTCMNGFRSNVTKNSYKLVILSNDK